MVDLTFVRTVNIPNLSLLPCLEMAYNWHERAAFQRSAFGLSTAGNDIVATSNPGRRLQLGRLTVLTNIPSTKVFFF